MPRRIFDEHPRRPPFTLGGPPVGHGGRRRGPAPLPAGTGSASRAVPRRLAAHANAGLAAQRSYPFGATHPTAVVPAPPARAATATPGTGRVGGLGAIVENEEVRGRAGLPPPPAAEVRARPDLRAALLPRPLGAPAPPPYAELCASVQLTSAQLVDLSCPISLDGADTLLEPVALRAQTVLHVFAYDLLWQHWVVRGDNPLTRRPFAWEELLRVEVAAQVQAPVSAVQRPSAVFDTDLPPPVFGAAAAAAPSD